MRIQLNYLSAKKAGGCAPLVGALAELAEAGPAPPRERLARLTIHLDWVQYKQNFREPVLARRTLAPDGSEEEAREIALDVRRVDAQGVRERLAQALAALYAPADDAGQLPLEPFGPASRSVIWAFNELFWKHLVAWEAAAGRGFEGALPGGRSDANHPDFVRDGVLAFCDELDRLRARGELPEELFVVEIGVGTGERAVSWLDELHRQAAARGADYYGRVRFLMGDYSPPILDRARAVAADHLDQVSTLVLDALDPLKSLRFLRYKVLHIFLSNVYDNLPTDEIVRRDGRLYRVAVRAYLPASEAEAVAAAHGISVADLPQAVKKLLDIGPLHYPDAERGVAFWRDVWQGIRLEERYTALGDASEVNLAPGLDGSLLALLLEQVPGDIRFHLSNGAIQSFVNTLPLLHPRGSLEVQDIFVTDLEQFRTGFRGPGKYDGSVVNWVNGPLLREVAGRFGYAVRFRPFAYRPGANVSLLRTSLKA